jgi:MFS family permease
MRRSLPRRRRSTGKQQQLPPLQPPPRWLAGTAVALLAVCLLGLFSTEIADSDFWWHLKTGQYIAEQRSLPAPDPFAYTTALKGDAVAYFNLTHEWLSQLMLYLIYAGAGFGGVIIVRAALLAAVCGLSGFLAARLTGSLYAGLAAAIAAASIAVHFAADRPALVTFLGVAVLVTLLELRRWRWAAPVLMLIWANCHGGFFLGWVVLLAYCAGEDRRRLWPVAASSIAISGLNPNGFGVLPTLLDYRRSELTASLVEWRPPPLWGPPYGFDVLLYAAVIVLAISWRRVRLPHWAMFISFAAASLLAFRNIMLIGFLAPVLIAAYWPLSFRAPRVLAWAAPALIGAALLAGVSTGAFFQLRVAAWSVPEAAAEWLRAHHAVRRMFNTYEQGGYWIWRLWPQERVFIDGRALSEPLYREYQRILFNDGSYADQVAGPRAELLDQYGIQVVVMNTLDYVSGALYPLALALANPSTPDWQLVYEDAQEVIFMRHLPADIPALPDKFGRVLRHLDAECEAYIAHSPDTPLCARTLGDYWLRNGVKDRGRRMFQLYLQHAQTPDLEVERRLQQLR